MVGCRTIPFWFRLRRVRKSKAPLPWGDERSEAGEEGVLSPHDVGGAVVEGSGEPERDPGFAPGTSRTGAPDAPSSATASAPGIGSRRSHTCASTSGSPRASPSPADRDDALGLGGFAWFGCPQLDLGSSSRPDEGSRRGSPGKCPGGESGTSENDPCRWPRTRS